MFRRLMACAVVAALTVGCGDTAQRDDPVQEYGERDEPAAGPALESDPQEEDFTPSALEEESESEGYYGSE